MFKSCEWVGVVAYSILVSAQGPLVLGLGVWGLGLTIQMNHTISRGLYNSVHYLSKWESFLSGTNLNEKV